MKLRFTVADISLILLIALESYFLFCSKQQIGQTTNAVLYTSTSILIGVILILKFINVNASKTDSVPKDKKTIRFSYALFALGVLSIISLGNGIADVIQKYPLSSPQSDVIPMVQHMVQRFMNGEFVYTPIYDFGYKLSPTYMPLHWMPYSIAEKFHLDYRWMAFFIWAVAAILLIRETLKTENYIIKLVCPLAIYLLFSTMLTYDNTVIANTLELTIAAYYMLLIVGINQSSYIKTGLTIGLCLMSRYSLVLWLPLYLFVMMASGEKKYALKSTLIVIAVVFIVYVLPFFIQDPKIYGNTIKQYLDAAIGEWEHINPANGKPYQLYSGTGFAHIFYEKLHTWKPIDAIKRLQKIHFIATLGTSLLLGVWYWRNRNRINNRIFLMASFKIYFAVFLAFIQVPYVYLMMVANFVSIAIFTEQIRYRQIHKV